MIGCAGGEGGGGGEKSLGMGRAVVGIGAGCGGEGGACCGRWWVSGWWWWGDGCCCWFVCFEELIQDFVETAVDTQAAVEQLRDHEKSLANAAGTLEPATFKLVADSLCFIKEQKPIVRRSSLFPLESLLLVLLQQIMQKIEPLSPNTEIWTGCQKLWDSACDMYPQEVHFRVFRDKMATAVRRSESKARLDQLSACISKYYTAGQSPELSDDMFDEIKQPLTDCAGVSLPEAEADMVAAFTGYLIKWMSRKFPYMKEHLPLLKQLLGMIATPDIRKILELEKDLLVESYALKEKYLELLGCPETPTSQSRADADPQRVKLTDVIRAVGKVKDVAATISKLDPEAKAPKKIFDEVTAAEIETAEIATCHVVAQEDKVKAKCDELLPFAKGGSDGNAWHADAAATTLEGLVLHSAETIQKSKVKFKASALELRGMIKDGSVVVVGGGRGGRGGGCSGCDSGHSGQWWWWWWWWWQWWQ